MDRIDVSATYPVVKQLPPRSVMSCRALLQHVRVVGSSAAIMRTARGYQINNHDRIDSTGHPPLGTEALLVKDGSSHLIRRSRGFQRQRMMVVQHLRSHQAMIQLIRFNERFRSGPVTFDPDFTSYVVKQAGFTLRVDFGIMHGRRQTRD